MKEKPCKVDALYLAGLFFVLLPYVPENQKGLVVFFWVYLSSRYRAAGKTGQRMHPRSHPELGRLCSSAPMVLRREERGYVASLPGLLRAMLHEQKAP
jgi:hypothetical protein